MKLAALFAFSVSVFAADTVLNFDAAQTKVNWTLPTVLHTVHGTFQFKSGTVHFDPATGKAGGAIIVDARSGESGSSSRDQRMHKSILESAKYTEFLFTPDRVEGQVPTAGAASLKIHGMFTLHGTPHEITLPVELKVEPAQISINSTFKIPYIAWGLKNPSTFVLKVNDNVDIAFQSVGRVTH